MAAAVASGSRARRYSTSTAATRPPPCTPPARRAPPVCRSSSMSSGRGRGCASCSRWSIMWSPRRTPDPAKLAAGRGHPRSGICWGPAAGCTAYVLAHCPNARWVCVTLGADGAVAVAADGTVTRVPAWPLDVTIHDTTGAGDAFIGATAVGLARGLPLEDTLRLASCVAAANCCADGARGGMPTRAQLPAEIRELLDRGR